MGLFRAPHLVAILLLSAPLGGCATSNLPDSLSQLSLVSRSRGSAESATDRFDPFPPRNSTADATTDEETAVQEAVQTVAHSIPSQSDPSATALPDGLEGHDPATRQLIEEELRDATPKERRELIRDLQGVDPPMVRQILKIRRMVQQMGQSDDASKGASHRRGAQHAALTDGGHTPADAEPAPASVDPFDPTAREPGREDVIPAAGHSLTGHDAPISRSPMQASYNEDVLPPTPSDASARSDEAVRHSTVHTADVRATFEESFGHSPAERPDRRTPASRDRRVDPRALEPAGASFDDIPVIDATDHLVAKQSSSSRVAEIAPRRPGAERSSQSDEETPHDVAPYESGSPSASWEDALHRAISEVEAEVAHLSPGAGDDERHEYIARHVALRMLYFVAGEHERALQAVPYIEPADQEFWQQMFWAIANYFDSKGMPDSSDRATQTVSQLKVAVQRLQEKAQLQLRNVAFCHKISSYGNYERFKRDEFSPGQPVLLYAEVDNFKSEPTADGQYRTILKSTIEIYKAGPNGDLVYREPFAATEDLCRNYRRDYFHSYEFSIPQRIALGPHVLKLTVEDQLSRKLTTYSLNFTVK